MQDSCNATWIRNKWTDRLPRNKSQDGISYNSFGEGWKDIKILALDPTRSLSKPRDFLDSPDHG